MEVNAIATISMTREIKLTTEDATKILSSQLTETLKELLRQVYQESPTYKENKLIAKFLLN